MRDVEEITILMVSQKCILEWSLEQHISFITAYLKALRIYTPCGSNSLLALYSLFWFLWEKFIAPRKCQQIHHKECQQIFEKHFLFTFGGAIVFCHNKARRLLVPQGVFRNYIAITSRLEAHMSYNYWTTWEVVVKEKQFISFLRYTCISKWNCSNCRCQLYTVKLSLVCVCSEAAWQGKRLHTGPELWVYHF